VTSPKPVAYFGETRRGQEWYILFGQHGASVNDVSNDVWRFVDSTETWKLIVPNSPVIPPARHSVTCDASGGRIWCHGGIDASGAVLSDVNIFNLASKTWASVEIASDSSPGARFGHAIFFYGNPEALYLYGGEGMAGIQYNDLWKLRLIPGNGISATWTKINVPAPRPSPRVYFGFAIHIADKIAVAAIRGGNKGNSDAPIFDEWYLTLNEGNMKWEQPQLIPPAGWTSESFSYAAMGFSNLGPRFVSHGGNYYGYTYPTNPFWATVKGDSNIIQQLIGGSNPRGRTGHALSSSGIDIFLFGGISQNAGRRVSGLFLGDVWKYRARDACPAGASGQTTSCFLCSAGTYSVMARGGKWLCESCPEGKYSAGSHATSCSKCPRGFYSRSKSADSSQMCLPCAAGTYGKYAGQALCLDCNNAVEICPPGTIQPLPQEALNSMFQLNSSIVAPVPYIYENTTREVEKYVQLVQIVGLILAMGALFMLLFLGGLLGPYVKEMITATDIFSDKHLHPLGPIWTRNMFVGGLITWTFSLVAVTMILALGIKYFLDNDLVQNALVPKLWSQGVAFTSNFSVAVSALGYKGACVGNLTDFRKLGTFMPCTGKLKALTSGGVRNATNIEPSCRAVRSIIDPKGVDCQIKYTCIGCGMNSLLTPLVNFSFMDPDAAALGLQVNVTTTSGLLMQKPAYTPSRTIIEDKQHQTSGYSVVYKGASNSLIRGENPFIFKSSVIPVAFNISAADVNEVGFFAQLKSTVQGSTVDADSYYFGSGIHVVVNLEVSDLVFTSTVVYRQTISALIALLLGTLAGTMAVGHAVLYYIENGIYYKMQLTRWYRRQRGFLARYVTKLQSVFLSMEIEGRDSVETTAFLWAKLHKDYYWRISDKHLQRQLFEYNNAVTLEDVRDAITEFDADNDGLVDYSEFEQLLSLVGVLPPTRLSLKESKTFYNELRNQVFGNSTLSDNQLQPAGLEKKVVSDDHFTENLERNSEIRAVTIAAPESPSTAEETHEWMSSLISQTKTAGLKYHTRGATVEGPPTGPAQ